MVHAFRYHAYTLLILTWTLPFQPADILCHPSPYVQFCLPQPLQRYDSPRSNELVAGPGRANVSAVSLHCIVLQGLAIEGFGIVFCESPGLCRPAFGMNTSKTTIINLNFKHPSYVST